MRQLPKKPRYKEFQKLRFKSNWLNCGLGLWTGGIVVFTRCRLLWRHFEMIRLRLAWGLGKKRRLSKKEQYRKKVEKSSITYFKRLKKKKKVKCHFWYTGFPHILVTRKAQGGRMGKGKGNIKIWYYPNYEGRFLLVVRGYDYYTLRKLLKSILKRLPIKGKVVFNQVNINTQIYETLFPSSTWWR